MIPMGSNPDSARISSILHAIPTWLDRQVLHRPPLQLFGKGSQDFERWGVEVEKGPIFCWKNGIWSATPWNLRYCWRNPSNHAGGNNTFLYIVGWNSYMNDFYHQLSTVSSKIVSTFGERASDDSERIQPNLSFADPVSPIGWEGILFTLCFFWLVPLLWKRGHVFKSGPKSMRVSLFSTSHIFI